MHDLVSSCQQETLHGFRRPGEGVWLSTSKGHLVSAEKIWCEGVDCATGTGDVCKCVAPCPCWWGVQWRVWSEGRCSPGLSTQPTALHHCAWSLITRVPLWGPWKDLYADDLVIIAESLEDCVRRLLTWKEAMEKKRLRVNAGKTKIMIWGMGLDLLQSSGEFLCAICCTGVGSNSIFCNGCKHWVHKKCSGLKRLTKDPDYRCTWCQGTARPLDGRHQKEIQVGPDKLEVVASFCYLGDMLSAAGGCELSTTTRVKTAWKKFKELLPVLFQDTSLSRHVSLCTVLVWRVQCSMPVRLGYWQNQTSNVSSGMTGQWSDRSAMSGCKMSPPGPMSYLRGLALRSWTSFWRRDGSAGMDMWNTPMVQSRHLSHTGWGKVWAWEAQGDMKAADRDCREWKLSAISPHDRNMWRSGMRSAMRAASQLSGRGAHWCGCCPCTCMLMKNLIMIYDMYMIKVTNHFCYNQNFVPSEMLSALWVIYMHWIV